MKNILKNKRRFRPLNLLLCIIVSLLSFCFTGCDLFEKKEATQEVIMDVKFYFKQKYGINATIIDSEAEYEWECSLIIPHKDYTGDYRLECEAFGRKFNVYVSKYGDIKDDYQHNDIKKSLEKYFSEMLPSSDIKIKHSTGLLSEYIDCSDIDGFLNKYSPNITIYLVDLDLNSESFDEIKNFAQRYNSTITLMSCRNEGHREAAVNGILTQDDSKRSYDKIIPDDYAMYVKEVWQSVYSYSENTHVVGYYEYNIGSYGDLYYTLPENSEVEVIETNEDCYFEDEYHKYKLITPSFDISCSDNIIIFYPVSKAKKVEPKSYQEYKCNGNPVDIIGDYFVYRYNYSNDNKNPDRTLFGVYIK